MAKRALTGAVWLLLATRAVAGPPNIDDVVVDSRTPEPSLAAVFDSWLSTSGDGWLGWHVPLRPAEAWLCCWGDNKVRWRQAVCDLEGSHHHSVFSSDRPDGLSNNRNLLILMRRSEGRLDEMRIFSDGCPLRAGGADLLWLEGVETDASVALMEKLARTSTVAEDALMALSFHDSPVAPQRLSILARRSESSDLRGDALFWLAQTGAPEAQGVLLEAVTEDPVAKVREQAVFAVSLLPDGKGSPVLLQLARDRSQPSSLRQEAFFWFVQADKERALELIDEILSR